MKRLAALLLLAATPALAANDETPTILRGTPAPPPPAVVEVPVPQVSSRCRSTIRSRSTITRCPCAVR